LWIAFSVFYCLLFVLASAIDLADTEPEDHGASFEFYPEKLGKYVDTTMAGLDCVVIANAKYPKYAIVLLHSYEKNKHDLAQVGRRYLNDHMQGREVMIVSPTGPDKMGKGAGWGPRPGMNEPPNVRESTATYAFKRSSELVRKLFASIHKLHGIKYSNIIVGGFSQGAQVALDAALNFESDVSVAMLWSTTVINGEAWRKLLPQKRNIKVFVAQGKDDGKVEAETMERVRDLIKDNGNPLVYYKFPGGHAITGDVIRESGKFVLSVIDNAPLPEMPVT